MVFVVSAGNISRAQVGEFLENGQQYPTYFANEESCILDPGQSALALTVGAIASSTLAIVPAGSASVIALQDQPSPFTRCGPGISREIKPEMVDFGGNYLVENEGGQVRMNPGTNIIMASNRNSPPIILDSGTSFAAPRVTHKLALLHRDLLDLGIENISAPLLKAFIVNSASYRGIQDDEGAFRAFLESMESVKVKHWLQVVGYGMPDNIRATYCDPYSAILYFQGILPGNKVAYFDVPVPISLANTGNGTKRMTVTAAYAPEVQRWGLEQYLGTTLKWRVFRGDVSREEIVAAMSNEDDDNTGQVERPNELKFDLGITLRSRGTVQHDVLEWSSHRDEYSANHYTLAIAAYEKWGRINPDPVPFGVVVRLEDTTRTAEIYTEIEAALNEIQVQTRTRM